MKTFEYPAVFQPCQDDSWCVYFPDLPGCISWGKSLEEAKAQAKEALSLHVFSMLQDNESLPRSGSASFSLEDGDIIAPVPLDLVPPTPVESGDQEGIGVVAAAL